MTTTLAPATGTRWQRAARLADLAATGHHTVHVGNQAIVLWLQDGAVYAISNRCPHMGFPLDRGTCRDGILTCHWHAARFDLRTGGTFDPFADDAPVFPVELRDDEIWVDMTPRRDLPAYYLTRLRHGLEGDIRLVLAKSAIALLDGGGAADAPFTAALEFGARNRRQGWGQGLTMLTCCANLLPLLDPEDRPLALYQGLSAVARETAGAPPRFVLEPLPGAPPPLATLQGWLRQFLAVRDAEGAERVVVSAVQAGAAPAALAELLFTAATDYRYIQIGHAIDFTNKAFEALDLAGWAPERAALVLSSVVRGLALGSRQEESNAWRHPIDLVAILEAAFPQIPAALAAGQAAAPWSGRVVLASRLLEDDPAGNIAALLAALRAGATPAQLAEAVSYAAALRIARFPTSNEFGDWDTTLHTFSFAHAMHMAVGRAPAPAVLRGVFDAAMSVYLDRFLNIPAARLPQVGSAGPAPATALAGLLPLLDQQQQVNEAGALVAGYLAAGGSDAVLLARLGKALLREDRDFHTIQTVEAAANLYGRLRGTPEAGTVLVAAARYLAAHAPTSRSQAQTYAIALRLHRGERVFEG